MKTFKLLSNRGQVGGKYNSLETATEMCLRLNTEFQNTEVFYSVVEITPFRLYIPLADAEMLQTFPYEIIELGGAFAVWYMTEEEYREQLSALDDCWRIRFKGGELEAEFDDEWYDDHYDEYMDNLFN